MIVKKSGSVKLDVDTISGSQQRGVLSPLSLKSAECYRDLCEWLFLTESHVRPRLYSGIIGCHRESIPPRKLYFHVKCTRSNPDVPPDTLSADFTISPAINGIMWPRRIFPGRKIPGERQTHADALHRVRDVDNREPAISPKLTA